MPAIMLTPATRAVLYLRSSKDRHDASIDAQRRELQEMAKSKDLLVTDEFSDAVESANDVNRPGFAALLLALKNPARGWSTVLVTDTARLARNVYLAESVKHECRKHGVKILFSKLPEVNPMIDMVVQQVVQAFDQMHSMMSREKGLAGMAENIRQGWRAGGRAPYGYQLEAVATGAIRDGQPVHKSRLVIDPQAGPKIAAYLRARLVGASITTACNESGVTLVKSTLNWLEFNALVYAGHTVWNRHAGASAQGGYEGGAKLRPREEWVVQRDTHAGLITEAEADAVLAGALSRRMNRTRLRTTDYLLAGILVTPGGLVWQGNAGYYRAGKQNIKAESIERAVMARLMKDMMSEDLARRLAESARKAAAPQRSKDELASLRKRVDGLNTKIARVSALIGETATPRPLLVQIEKYEAERTELSASMGELAQQEDQRKTMELITDADVRAILTDMAEGMDGMDRDQLRSIVHSLLSKIDLEKGQNGELTARFHYIIPHATGVMVASPRRTNANPTIVRHKFGPSKLLGREADSVRLPPH